MTIEWQDDFYCPNAKLCVECDGLPHFTPGGIERDTRRTEWLSAQGIEVIRFTSREIEQKTQRLLSDIDTVLKRLLKCDSPPHPPTPSPPEEEKGSQFQTIATGLSMPHSPRWYDGKLPAQVAPVTQTGATSLPS